MSGQFEGFEPETKKRKQEIKREFKVYINEDEMERIRQWVALRPDIETGGDLFGLWIDQHTAVVQFVLGPGKNCHRTTTSFFQDVSYLENVGSYLTEKHGLCNIGQWHSHHTIPLFQPSVGDNNTVWSNMPTLGMERYIVFIANIKTHDVTKKPSDVTVNCFLFEINDGKQLPVIQGCFNTISGESPFRLNNDVMDIVRIEAEILTGGKKEKEVQQLSKLSEESVGRKEETEIAALLPQEDQGNAPENAMHTRSTQNTDDKAVSVSDKNTPDVPAGTSGFKDKRTVDNSKMGGTKNNSKVQKSNQNFSSNIIIISNKGNSLVDNKRTSTKTVIPTFNDSNHDSSNNGKDNTKSEENKNGEGKKNDNTSNTSTNVSSNTNDTTITSSTSTNVTTTSNVTSATSNTVTSTTTNGIATTSNTTTTNPATSSKNTTNPTTSSNNTTSITTNVMTTTSNTTTTNSATSNTTTTNPATSSNNTTSTTTNVMTTTSNPTSSSNTTTFTTTNVMTTTTNPTTSNTFPNVISTITNVASTTVTPKTLTPTQTQSNEQHSKTSQHKNATIEQHLSTTSESDNVKPNDNNDKEQESTPEYEGAVTKEIQLSKKNNFEDSESSQRSDRNNSCFRRILHHCLCGR